MHEEHLSDKSRTDNTVDETIDQGLSVRALYLGIFLTSAGVLLLEISLTRIFSYTIWYHFTYVTISLAMLGFGASGALLASSEKLAGLGMKLAQRSVLVGAVSVPVMLLVVSKIPFYPFQLFKEPVQIVYMIVYYVAVTLPFLCAGLAISCAFKSIPREANRIYFWDLIGAGTGCLTVVVAINLLGVPSVTAITATLFLLASAMFLGQNSGWRKPVVVAAALIWIPLALNIEMALEFKASTEKWISRMTPEKILFSKWSPIFRVDVFKLPEGNQKGKRPVSMYGISNDPILSEREYAFIAHDGDACARMIESDRELSPYESLQKGILQAPYLLSKNPDVLIIGPGGGVDVGMALRNEASSVLAVELDPITIDLVKHKYADFVGHLYDRPGVEIIADEGRSFLRRTEEKFDLIQMTAVDTLAALSSGAYVLAENYLYTTEAYCDFMDRLNPEGVLCISTRDKHYTESFPRFAARQMSLSITALKMRGITNAGDHIAIMATEKRGITWLSLITKISPFSPWEVSALREFAEDRSFDIWYLPGKQVDNPCALLVTATEEERLDFYRDQPLQVRAATDEAPFYYHFYKWATLLKQHQIDTGHVMATGQLILLLILAMSILFSVALIVFPLFRFQRAGLQSRWKWHYILYFASLGLGFIFIEISYLQKFILFLGYPTHSLTVILFALLTFSGVGSYLSGRLLIDPQNIIKIAFCMLAVVGVGYILVLPPIFDYFLGASKPVRVAISLVLLFPLGLLLGVFFPAGIKIISEVDSRFIPWAWGVNGCASVIGTVLSIIIAMTYGFSIVTVLAVIIYAVGVSAMAFASRGKPSFK